MDRNPPIFIDVKDMDFHKFKWIVLNLISSTTFKNKEYLLSVNLRKDRNYDDYFIEATFNSGLSKDEMDSVLDEIWKTIYSYTGETVYIVNRSRNKMNEQEEDNHLLKQKKIVERFLENIEIEGVHGFWTDVDESDVISVYVVFDENFLISHADNLGWKAKEIKTDLKKKITNYTGVENIWIGSTVKYND